MKAFVRLLALSVIIAAVAWAQVSQHGIVAVSGAPTAPLNSAASLPGTCTPWQLIVLTTATAGSNLDLCTSSNVWTTIGLPMVADGTGTITINTSVTPIQIGTTPGVVPLNAGANTMTGYNNFAGGQMRLPESTVASLPTASSNTGKEFIVLDGVSPSDCTVGGGSTVVNMCRSNGAGWIYIGNTAGAGLPTCSTAGQSFLYPLNAAPSSDLGAFTPTANRVYLFALNPFCNYTMRQIVVYQNGISASKGIAVALMDSTGTILQQNTQVGAFSANTAIRFPITAQGLTGGSLYYVAISTEDTVASIFRTAIGPAVEQVYDVNGQVLVAKCTNAASGAGVSFVINTCGTLIANASDIGVPSIVVMP